MRIGFVLALCACLWAGLWACAGAKPMSTPAPAPTTEGDAATPQSPAAVAYAANCRDDVADARARFGSMEAASGPRTRASVLEPLNDLWIVLDRVQSLAGLYRNVHPEAGVRTAAEQCEQEVSRLVTEIGLSRPLFDAVAGVDTAPEDAVTRHWVSHLLRDFRRSGVDKDDATRAKVRALRDELVVIAQDFDRNIQKDVREVAMDPGYLAGLPEDYIAKHAPGTDGKVRLTTEYPDYVPYMTYAKSDATRLAMYRTYRKRGHPANLEVLSRMLDKRHALALLLGYRNWAHYITEDKMIRAPEKAHAFIDRIAELAKKRAATDYGELLERVRKDTPAASEVGDWQKAYVEEQVKREAYQFDSQALRAYFPYARVKQGVFDLTQSLFGVQILPIRAETWDPSVESYEMLDNGVVLGRFHLDMHPRADKYSHAAAFPIRSGVPGRQVPEAALVCNFPTGDELMQHGEVVTFFHEFGHLLHHLFGGSQRWLGVTGFNVEWDFVEAPSQMLEEWAFSPAVLRTFARNAAGETVPDDLIAKLRRARDFGKGLMARHQMFYAALSLDLYDRDPTGLDTTARMKELQSKYSPFSYVDDTYFHLSFGHLEGYSAIYYTYMWSLVIAKDLLSAFDKPGLLDTATAARYRKLVLEPGGSKDAEVLVRDFLGRDYGFKSFERWLNAGER